MQKIGIFGSKGKMGQSIIFNLSDFNNYFTEIIKYSRDGDISLDDFIEKSDVILDFSSSDGTIELLNNLGNRSKKILIGTTGHEDLFREFVKKFSIQNSIMLAPNTSIFVNLISEIASEISKKFNHKYKISINETHHIEKKDSPSGTAKMIMKKILDKNYPELIPIESKRIDDVIGNHEIIFSNDYETLKITHIAKSRKLFAIGAIECSIWLSHQKPGLYRVMDMLQYTTDPH